LANGEDDCDRRGRSFGRERGRIISSCGNHSHLSANQIGHQCRKAIVLAFDPMVFDRYVSAIDVAGFAEPLIESGHITRVGIV
jgi:hypothetical protein